MVGACRFWHLGRAIENQTAAMTALSRHKQTRNCMYAMKYKLRALFFCLCVCSSSSNCAVFRVDWTQMCPNSIRGLLSNICKQFNVRTLKSHDEERASILHDTVHSESFTPFSIYFHSKQSNGVFIAKFSVYWCYIM